MKQRNGELITNEVKVELDFLECRNGVSIDLTQMPEVLDWSDAIQGKFFRPVKQPFSIRLDSDIVAWFKSSGDGYQTRINAALREYVLAHQPANKSN
jgi:uncharacterized protein (DUF4415 family)